MVETKKGNMNVNMIRFVEEEKVTNKLKRGPSPQFLAAFVGLRYQIT